MVSSPAVAPMSKGVLIAHVNYDRKKMRFMDQLKYIINYCTDMHDSQPNKALNEFHQFPAPYKLKELEANIILIDFYMASNR